MDVLQEVTTDLEAAPLKWQLLGDPVFMAYGCYVYEKSTDNGYIYTAVNPQSGKTEVLCHRKTFIGHGDTKVITAIADKLKKSDIAGYSRLLADRKYGENITLGKCAEIMDAIFYEIMPRYGYAVRESQAELAQEMLGAISRRQVMLAEGETGTGKTWAYLVAAILVKRGRVDDFWNKGYYPDMQYIDMAHMPIVVATSSIALQKALVNDYIPRLSGMLQNHGIIDKPITAVLRKGRGHYVCERKLRAHQKNESDPETKNSLTAILKTLNKKINVDLMELSGLSAYTKRKICVPNHCDHNCPYYSGCAYLDFRSKAQSREIDIQVCNHQYLLADTINRAANKCPPDYPYGNFQTNIDWVTGKMPLIPNYQSIIIDEGFGRLIRTIEDTGVVAILDGRVSRRGSYRRWVLNVLPKCRVTDDINDVEGFMREKKPLGYFE